MKRFRKVPRHNGFRASQLMTAPINEDKAEVRNDLLKSVTNPVRASIVEGFDKALEDWETTQRLFTEADGKLPDPEIMRLGFVGMLPHEVYTYVSLHLDMEEDNSLGKLKQECSEICQAIALAEEAKACTCG